MALFKAFCAMDCCKPGSSVRRSESVRLQHCQCSVSACQDAILLLAAAIIGLRLPLSGMLPIQYCYCWLLTGPTTDSV